MATRIAADNTRAQAERLSFSHLMYKKLPKELRDLVYSFFCLEDRQIPIGPYYHYRKYEPRMTEDSVTYTNTQFFPRSGSLHTELSDGKTRIDHDIYPQDDLLLPHNLVFKASYVGTEVAIEALKTYYECNKFSICNVEGGLDNLCTAIKYGGESMTDFVPIDHIRDLQIRVKLEHLHSALKAYNSSSEPPLQTFAKQEPVLRSTIESLRGFRSRMQTAPPHELNLEIVLMSEMENDTLHPNFLRSQLLNLLQTVRNMVYELLHDRGNTTVLVTHQDESLWAFPKNYTGLFKLTKEQWHYEISKQQQNQDWSQHFWILPIESEEYSDSELSELGGYCCNAVNDYMSQRWGVEDVLRATTNSKPVEEGPYWPIGKPYNPQVARVHFEYTEQACSK
ncbi:hypothetical protein SVAN01_04846 [Stagonosporopsis vannaccii]|nr:hypothetical protein SVAN01_04846 [Stagonosporopsis vannaccii]